MIQDELDVLERNIRGENFDLGFVATHARAMAQIANDALEMSKRNESPIYMIGEATEPDAASLL